MLIPKNIKIFGLLEKENSMKKRAVATFLALACTFTFLAVPAHAYASPSDGSGISTQSETVRWYFRTNNGVREMRLWSITYQKWLTDWIVCPDQP